MSKTELDMSKGMTQAELKPCAFCRKGVAHSDQILSTRVRITRMGLNVGAVRRQTGLEMMVGGLAQHMGPDEKMLVEIEPEVTLLVCDQCAVSNLVLQLHEAVGAQRVREGQAS